MHIGPPQDLGTLTFCWFLRPRGSIVGFCRGVILIVARHSFRNLFRGELAVIFGMQNFGERTRIRGHCLKSSLSSQCGHRGNAAEWEVLPMPVENCMVLRRVG